MKMKRGKKTLGAAAIVCGLGMGLPLAGQVHLEGDLSPDFALPDRTTGETFTLHGREKRIIVLDFFAYWCAPCAFSSPDLEANVKGHYEEAGGNPQGLPVEVVSMNLEGEDPGLTDAFVEQVGMELVIDDVNFEAFSLYNDTGGIPLFVIINGYRNAEGLEQWEILLNQAGYPGSAAIRQIIDAIELDPESVDILFADLPDEGEGWRESPWFGWIHPGQAPFYFHLEHGWTFVSPESTETDLFYFDTVLGWLYTSRDLYPNIYAFAEESWLRYSTGSERWFWHDARAEWIQYPLN